MVNDAVFAGRSAGYTTASLACADSNWRWAQWNSTTSNAAWGARLTAPGNSETYVNPDSAGDTHLDVGNAITRNTGLNNNGTIKDPLDAVVTGNVVVVVPIYSGITGTKATISGFAKVEIESYNLNGADTMAFKFLGTCKSDGSAL
jgi:hypothetical protein